MSKATVRDKCREMQKQPDRTEKMSGSSRFTPFQGSTMERSMSPLPLDHTDTYRNHQSEIQYRMRRLPKLDAPFKSVIDAASQSPEKNHGKGDRIIEILVAVWLLYTLECPEAEAWTVYEIGQRLSETLSFENRVFLVGDAIHTHCPKGGQGMNVSMGDGFASPTAASSRCLITQQLQPWLEARDGGDRVEVAREVIDFDRKFSPFFSGKLESLLLLIPKVSVSKNFGLYGFGWGNGRRQRGWNTSLPDCGKLLSNENRVGEKQQHRIDAHAIQFADRLVSHGRWRLISHMGTVARASDSVTSAIGCILPYSAFPELASVGRNIQILSDEISYLDGGGPLAARHNSGQGVNSAGPGIQNGQVLAGLMVPFARARGLYPARRTERDVTPWAVALHEMPQTFR
ncbi:hypothetical protein DFH06DRAFT_1402770 [Mycena polygramma]|nr:hypothetical protein DFH06DRAFT_1402770 [Mycena polygramma]